MTIIIIASGFPLGQTVITPGAQDTLAAHGVDPSTLLQRHNAGDWGDLDDEDRAANDYSLVHGSRLLSAYKLNEHDTVWVITEADRSATTLLLPSEY